MADKSNTTNYIDILGATWTPKVNVYDLKCDCGHEFKYRCDRRRIRCPGCSVWNNVDDIRDRYVNFFSGEKDWNDRT